MSCLPALEARKDPTGHLLINVRLHRRKLCLRHAFLALSPPELGIESTRVAFISQFPDLPLSKQTVHPYSTYILHALLAPLLPSPPFSGISSINNILKLDLINSHSIHLLSISRSV
ncbi:hypothetical protein VTL71DRAFT_8225 [Oculimacula yallundae]|uniref:Uncharacterized protein n=1 Tax=Oculimacula yallundae TaxID=86028 RepID=A0ABR4CXZ0_9HELO